MNKTVAIFMAAMLTNLPHLAWAEAADQMIPTSAVVAEISRAQAQQNIEQILSKTEVRSELAKRGLSQEEISKRLASLTDAELRQFAKQMDQAQYAGDAVISLLVIVVLVLLIIYLAKRI
jgi:hypothetical protein